MYVCSYVCICIYVFLCLCVYRYIYRERESYIMIPAYMRVLDRAAGHLEPEPVALPLAWDTISVYYSVLKFM